MAYTLPYLKVFKRFDVFRPSDADDLIREAVAIATKRACYVEISDDATQCCLFLREGQIYSAGKTENGQFVDTTIKDFLLTTGQMISPRAACYEVNSKILHSLLILFQKKPALKLLSSLVDLDQVLDKIEEENRSCIVCATQGAFLAILRYEKGRVTALCHEASLPVPKERSFREDFLVRIYTLSAERPLEVTVYEDLLVKYAGDAKMIDSNYTGSISDLYLTKPPTVTLVFKGKEIGHWILNKRRFNIGRTDDNDIVIDNLAVSRLHAVLEKEKGDFYVRDCDSLNGTLLNGRKVGRAKIQHGDQIVIGKHTLRVRKQSGIQMVANPNAATFDQTVIIGPGQAPPQPAPQGPTGETGPRLVEKTESGDVQISLNKPTLVIGKDSSADIEIAGFLVARHHAEIIRENGDYVIRHVGGHRKVTVGGKTVKEHVLKDHDQIKIGKREFIFQE